MDWTILLYAIGTAIALFGAVSGVFAFWNSITAKMTTTKNTAESAKIGADHANTRIDTLIDEFSKQREVTARNIGRLEATNDGLTNAIRDMTHTMQGVVQRLDRVVERLPSTDHQHQTS